MLVRLATGCSWEDAERLMGNKVSDTTMPRRDEWIDAGSSTALEDEAQRAYDKIIGLDLSDTSVDGSLHKSPCGGEGTGRPPTRAKLGWKWSILTDLNGIPIGVAVDGANRNDSVIWLRRSTTPQPTGSSPTSRRLHLDRGYDSQWVRAGCAERGLGDLVIAERKRKNRPKRNQTVGASRSPSDCAGPSSGPTRGSRTSGSCGAIPTAPSAGPSWLRWPWPSH